MLSAEAEGSEADNTNRGLDNSRYHVKIESNNYFIMHKND